MLSTLPTINDFQKETMPIPTKSTENKIVQYVGESNATYTNGHFYKNTMSYSDVTDCEQADVDTETFKAMVNGTYGEYTFTHIGYPQIIQNVTKGSSPIPTITIAERYSTGDSGGMYCWKATKGSALYYTEKEIVNIGDKIYRDTAKLSVVGDITSLTRSTERKFWCLGVEDDVDMSEYGITNITGDYVIVDYKSAETYDWVNIDVQ